MNEVERAKDLFFKGLESLDNREFENAERFLAEALKLTPRSIPALNNLAIAQFQQEKSAEAATTAQKVIEIEPRNIDALQMLSGCQNAQGYYEEAIVSCQRIIGIEPLFADAHCNLGVALKQIGKYEEAIESFDRAISLNPQFADAFLNRGNSLYRLERHAEAVASYDKALSLNRDLEGAWLGRGNVFIDLKRYDEAIAAYDKALSIKPDLAEAWLGRGNVFNNLRRYDEAIAAYDKALSIEPDLENAWFGRGSVFCELKRYDEACAAYDRAISLAPDKADAYYNKALVKLCRGEFEEGWDLYEWRSQNGENIAALADLKSLQMSARQDRDVLVGKKVAILSEQGVGDEVMFSSILPDLLTDAKTIYYEVDPRLTRLFADAFPDVTVVPRAANRSYLREQVFDVVLQAGSLGYAYRRGAKLFPRVPYLSADPIRIDKWKGILAQEAGQRLKIGISWRGGTYKSRRDDRSIDLEQLAPLIQNVDRYFVSLQYGNVSEELARFNNAGTGKAVHCLLDDFNNFDDFAALVMALDLVISVQNTTVHVCGALGKTCWGMIPWRPEWRYGADGHEMIWYSSITLYRQKSAGHWGGLISRINSDLSRLLGSQME
jgi:tetratricopeptide (TPR) repeat protein